MESLVQHLENYVDIPPRINSKASGTLQDSVGKEMDSRLVGSITVVSHSMVEAVCLSCNDESVMRSAYAMAGMPKHMDLNVVMVCFMSTKRGKSFL
jgi:hypothetical protein